MDYGMDMDLFTNPSGPRFHYEFKLVTTVEIVLF